MIETLAYRATGKFKPLFLDYVEGNLQLDLVEHRPVLDSFDSAIQARLNFPQSTRAVLVDTMKRQHKCWGVEREQLINSLGQSQTYTITTGHQLSVFGGPLFVLNKILTVIRLAEELKKKYPDNNFVPVFWMATEDHDYEEVRELNVFGQDIRLETDVKGPVGRAEVGDFNAEVTRLAELLERDGNGEGLVEIIRSAYSEGTLSDATGRFWYSLLERYDFLILDGDDASLKGLFEKAMREELASSKLKTAVGGVETLISEAGYHVQAPVSQVNLFNLAGGDRVKFNSNEAESEVHYAVDLSPSVLFRPLYQESILPNLAYVGGPGEVSYWLQLKQGFEAFDIPMPIVWPRATALVLGARNMTVMDRHRISPEELMMDVNEIIKGRVVKTEEEVPPVSLITEEYLERLKESLSGYPDLSQQLEAVGARLHKDAEKLTKSVERQIKSQHEKPVKELQRLFKDVAGGLQDRRLSTVECILRNGEGVVESIYNSITFDDHGIRLIKD